mgnify:CR=1 FL=1
MMPLRCCVCVLLDIGLKIEHMEGEDIAIYGLGYRLIYDSLELIINPREMDFTPSEDLTNATVDVNGDGDLDAGYVKVWLRVWDDGDMDGIYGTAGDNYNETWTFVKVEDKLAPAIVCPPDVTLTCDMDYTDLNMTGSANGYASCGGIGVEYNDIIINLNTCNFSSVISFYFCKLSSYIFFF